MFIAVVFIYNETFLDTDMQYIGGTEKENLVILKFRDTGVR